MAETESEVTAAVNTVAKRENLTKKMSGAAVKTRTRKGKRRS
jgi:hypothetical protein